jgi:hypothetical protein
LSQAVSLLVQRREDASLVSRGEFNDN